MNNFTAMEKLLDRVKTLIDTVNRRTKAECRKAIEGTSSGAFDLSADEILVLRTMHALPGKVPLKRVVNALTAAKDETVHSSTVSAIMTRFKKNGLLSEEDNENDKRQPLNFLTPQGQELAGRLEAVDAVVLRNVIDCLQLDGALAADLTQRVDKASDRIREQLQQLQKQSKPSIAGIYDFALGGTWNTVVDRMFVEGNNIPPQRRQSARANRAFLQRAVHFLGKEKGITQFLDIGSGFPTNRNTHHVAADLNQNPPARITYVDNDPEVVRASRSLLSDADAENVRVVQEDLRFAKRWLAADRFQNIDLKKPVAVLLVAVLHFVADDNEVRDILQFLKQKLARGSYLAISHSTPATINKEAQQALIASYSREVTDIKLRTEQELTALLDGFELVDPGLVFISDWKRRESPDMLADEYIPPASSSLVACVAKI